MATKMQTKSYLPGYCSTEDVEDTSSWFGYYQDKKPSTHLCSNYVQSLVNRCSDNDKVMLKHTMLEHEMIFHNQVYELHRLYKTQKDLMTEFQTRGLYGSSIVAEASHSNSFTSQMQSECLEKRSQTSHHVGNNSYGKAVLACNDKFHFGFTREDSVQSHPNPLLNRDSVKDSKELGPKKRKKFDLHLPAHVYIDIEDTDESDQKIFSELPHTPSISKNETYSFSNKNDAKLTIGSIHKEEDQHLLNSLMQINISTCGMIDLNRPAKGASSEGPSNSQYLHLLGLKTHSESNQMHCSAVRSSTGISDRHCVQQTTSDYLYTDVLPKREWPLSRLECGKSSSSVDFLARTSANSNTPAVMNGNLHLNYTNTHRNNQTLRFAHYPEKWSGQELSARVTHFNSSVPASVTTPQAGLTSSAPTFVSSWAKPSMSTNAKSSVVQALPSFCPSSNPSNESLFIAKQIPITCEKSGSSRNSITGLEHGILVSRTNFHSTHDSSDATHLKHKYVKQYQNDHHNQTLCSNLPKDDQNAYLRRDLGTSMIINLNQAYQDATEDRHCVRVYTSDDLAESKYGKLLDSRTYFDESNDLKKPAAKVDFSFLNRHVQPSSKTHAVTPEVEREEKRFISLGKKEHLNNSTKILKNDDNMILTELDFDAKVIKSEKKTHIGDLYSAISDGKNRERVRSHINLNVEFPCVDHPMPLEELHDCEVVASSHSSPSFSAKTYVINLEAPISQAKMGSLNQHNHIPSCKKDASEELFHSGNTLQLAAQNLVDLSMDCRNCSNGITPNMLVKPTSDTLSWFAEVVVSCSAKSPNLISDGVDRGIQSSGNDGYDLFEAMTLNLKEIKTDQSSPKEINNKDEKKDTVDTEAASTLFTGPRHCQARKRRQRMDFQNDILPGLASLSRHEVTEDLQNIGEMMKASGRPWQTGSTKRNKCRNGMKSQTSRQSRNLAITIGEVQVSERNMIGWGRTTRRFRRQRCPPGGLTAST